MGEAADDLFDAEMRAMCEWENLTPAERAELRREAAREDQDAIWRASSLALRIALGLSLPKTDDDDWIPF